MQALDTFFERIAPEAQMLWAFIQGHILMMAFPAFIWFRVLNDHRTPDRPINFIPLIVCASIGLLWAFICWALIRFRFPAASDRFINVVRMAFHLIPPLILFIWYFFPRVLEPDPPGYISNNGLLFVAGLLFITAMPFITREAIFRTTKTYVEMRDKNLSPQKP